MCQSQCGGKSAWHIGVVLVSCPRPMTKLRRFLLLALLWLLPVASATAQPQKLVVEKRGPDSWLEYEIATGIYTATNGVIVTYENVVLTAERVTLDSRSGEALAEGRVRIQREDQVWAGDSIRYNLHTHAMLAEQFRTGKAPVFAQGRALSGGSTNGVSAYSAEQGYITTDDISEPATKLRADSITVIPNDRIIARHATLYLGGVPVFYFPYYSRRFDAHANQFTFTPGYRSRFGPYLLNTYSWFLSEKIDGAFHTDYRVKRGVAAGTDLNTHLGRWGDAGFKYYYLHDDAPLTDANGLNIPANRHRFAFNYDAMPWTNLNVKAQVNFESDALLLHDFFESEYRANPQPRTFVEVNKLWNNFSLDVFTQPRVNDFLETVESLPEVRLTSFRQQVGASPVFYESESSAGWYRHKFAQTNSISTGLDFEAARADTYHQIVLPRTYFGWLNVTPRAGGRFTYYSRADGPGAATDEQYRTVFNTGAEVSFKASRLWPGATNRVLDVNGLRHIVQPSVNYVYVPKPSKQPGVLPQFSYESPSLRRLPIEYPDYNAIDSVDSQNVLRLGLGNKLQTKRDGQLEDLLRWDLYTDWRLHPHAGQATFADLWSDLLFRPRSWLTLEAQTRYDVEQKKLRSSFVNLTLQPNDVWSWTIGNWYLRDDLSGTPTSLGAGNNLITSSFFYRLNENYSLRLRHHYEARESRLQEQFYTVYRDFRSWVGALTLRVRDDGNGRDDFTLAFTFSLKASPRYKVGDDTVRPYQLIGN
ncbi:MAG: LPS-assembly protein LptD [Pedosphaera sp.]|nr:LPS-assembly protein LptD [Pedosphaera sp.]